MSDTSAPDLLLVQSKVKDLIRRYDLRVDGALIDQLNLEVIRLVEAACARAKGNDRKTLKPVDL